MGSTDIVPRGFMGQLRTSGVRAGLFGVVMGLLAAVSFGAERPQVSTQPPPAYARHLASHLTSLEDARAGVPSSEDHAAEGHDNTIVLHETLRWVDGDGRVLLAQHEILRANTPAGVDAVARQRFAYRPELQKAHLILARTHLSSGETIEVRPEAVFVQTSEPLPGKGDLPSVAELVLVFPRVVPGALVESLVVFEEPSDPIPGEFTAFLTLDFFWPTGRSRQLLDLPRAWADRLGITPLGSVPSPTKVEDGDRVRLVWQKDQVPALVAEPGRAPLRQEGPAVWLSTLGSWDVFADWFRTLLKGRETLTPELAAEVDRWTANLSGPDEVLEVLHSKVADRIRFTEVALGFADFVPRAPDEVWGSGFGDAKDQANLLRAFLRQRGISSHLAFLDGTHSGRLETRSPGHRAFDHVILAVEVRPGEVVWCDPTVPGLGPGELGLGVADRQTLVVQDTGYRLSFTPRHSSGHMDLVFDFDVGPAGQLVGAGRLLVYGIRGALFRRELGDLSDENRRRALLRFLEPFFGEVDLQSVRLVEGPAGSAFDLQFRLILWKIIAPGRGGPLYLSHGGRIFPRLEQESPRQTSYFQSLESSRVQIRYRLPAGWAVAALPAPVELEGLAVTTSARWALEGDRLVATLTYQQRRSQVPASNHAGLVTMLSKLGSTLERPVWVGPRETVADLASGPRPQRPGRTATQALEGLSDALERRDLDQVLTQAAFLVGSSSSRVLENLGPPGIAVLEQWLGQREEIQAFWRSQDAWWPKWTALATGLGIEVSEKPWVLDEVKAEGEALVAELEAAFRGREDERFFALWSRLWQVGRWRPQVLLQAVEAVPLAVQRAPQQAAEIRGLALAALASPWAEDEGRRAQVLGAALLFDSGRPGEVLPKVREYFEGGPAPGATQQRMAMLWALSALALGKDLEPAGVALEEALSSASRDAGRTLMVETLAQIYRAQGQGEAEEKLLRRELGGAAGSGASQEALERRLRALETGGQDDEFGRALAQWLETHGPPWLDFARPRTLDDPRVGSPEEAISPTNEVFLPPEKFKIAILAAQDSGYTPFQRQVFFARALLLLDELTPRFADERRMLRAVMDEPNFSVALRQEAYGRLLENAAQAQLDDLLRQLLRHPLRRGLPPDRAGEVERLAARIERPRQTTPQIEAVLLELLGRPMDLGDQIFFGDLFQRLLNRGALDAAQRVVEALPRLRLAGGDTIDASRMRLELLQALSETRDLLPVAEALRRVVFERLDAGKVGRPDFWSDFRLRDAIDLMEVREARNARLWELVAGETDLRLLPWWMGSLLQVLPPGAERGELALELALGAARTTPDDETRQWFVLFGMDGIDDDDPDRMERFFRGLEAWRDPTRFPQTGEILRVLEATAALRRGEDPDLAAALGTLNQGVARRIGDRLRLRQALLRKDVEALRRLLATIEEERLLEPRTLDLHLPALQMAGLEEQVAVARVAGKEALYEALLRTWVHPESWDILLVFRLAEILHGKAVWPKAWKEYCLASVGNPRIRRLMELHDAELRGDWARALEHGEALWAEDATNSDRAWPVGRAAFHLENWDRAQEALGVFVKHAHDRLERAEALEMLEQIQARGL